MAQVQFFAMKLDFQELRKMMADKDFTGLVFQPILEDTEKWEDEFTLICYTMYDTKPGPRMHLKLEKDILLKARYRVGLGNLPMGRPHIQPFIDQSPDAPHLYLYPKQYEDYVAYMVTTDPQEAKRAITGGTEYELKPSPPAD